MAVATSYVTDSYANCPWYLAHQRDQAPDKTLVPLLDQMKRRQETLANNTKKCIAIFQWGGSARNVDVTEDPALEETCNAYNHAQNVVETVHAKICKSRILPMPLTSGAGYLARHRARQLGKVLEGEFAENHVDEIVEDVVMDALVTAHGAGAAKVHSTGGRVRIENVPIEDVWFDEAETRYRKPRCCYTRQLQDKFVLLEEYGENDPSLYGDVEERRSAILKAQTNPSSDRRRVGYDGDDWQVEVYEAWHLPSCDLEEEEYEDDEGDTKRRYKANDGRHVIAIDGCTLVDEPWDADYFPIQFYVPRKRRRHIWGLSLMFDLVAPQREHEKLTAKIQNAHQKNGVSGMTAPKSANINVREITAGTYGAGFLVEYDGQQPPQPFVVDPIPPGVYAYKDSIPRDMMQAKGVSQLSASSQVPAGLSQASGKALQVFEDFESERLLVYHREHERFVVGLAWLVVKEARRLVDAGTDYEVRYRGKKGLERLKWSDVLMDEDDLVLRVFPVSQLSKQPSARFAQLTELLNAQAITVEQFKRLYELPDLEAENEIDTADTDIIDRNLDIIVTSGRYMSPEPFDDLDLLIKRAGKFYNLCRANEVPDARLKLIADLITDAKSLKDQAAQAAAPPPGAPPMGGPPGMPPPGPPGPPGMPPGPPPGPPGAPPGAPPGPPPAPPMAT